MICSFWVAQSNKAVLKIINKVNYRNAAMFRNMLNYSPLFVKLLHDKIRKALHKIKDICLDEREICFVILQQFA